MMREVAKTIGRQFPPIERLIRQWTSFSHREANFSISETVYSARLSGFNESCSINPDRRRVTIGASQPCGV
jgi:hypothetical protein